MMSEFSRVPVPPVAPLEDRGIRRQYPLDAAAWLWHPEAMEQDDSAAAVQFACRFELDEGRTLELEASADQRFVLRVDGQRVGMGPDRSDPDHWSLHRYRLTLDAGVHELEADVWWLDPAWMPMAQTTVAPGFACAAVDPADAAMLNTGLAPWRARRLRGWSFSTKAMGDYHVIGPRQTIDARATGEPWVPAVRVAGPVDDNPHGVVSVGRRLLPTPLPEMRHERRPLGAVRCATDRLAEGEDEPWSSRPVTEAQAEADGCGLWTALVGEGRPLVIPAGQCRAAIVELQGGDYDCGFAEAELSGDGRLSFEWAEAMFEPPTPGQPRRKGHRDAVAGRVFFGYGDDFVAGGERRRLEGCWWRSGRFVRLWATAGRADLVLHSVHIRATGYALGDTGTFASSDARLDAVLPLARRGLACCMHELYVDCPYYEQAMYAGDTRVQMLINHVLSPDDRLVRRGVELFEWSRGKTSLVAERAPSTPHQSSTTFALMWVLMVRDHAWWRDEPAWARQRLPAVRSQIEQVLTWSEDSGLAGGWPGWSFVDWVDAPGWRDGRPPGAGRPGGSSILSLHLLLALRVVVELERALGEPELAQRAQRRSEALADAIFRRFWDPARGLLGDLPTGAESASTFSEHAQALALLADAVPEPRRAPLADALATPGGGLAPATIYFQHYVFEALHAAGRGGALVDRLEFWKKLPERGFRTPPEQPEPTRSDCHAWGSHPLFHVHASLAGVRPGGAGYRHVRIAPTPGSIEHLESVTPHPRGQVRVELRLTDADRGWAEVQLPEATPGEVVWAGRTQALAPGFRGRVALEPRP